MVDYSTEVLHKKGKLDIPFISHITMTGNQAPDECKSLGDDINGQVSTLNIILFENQIVTGWFFGFKLHVIFNDRSELLSLMLTPGKVDNHQSQSIHFSPRIKP